MVRSVFLADKLAEYKTELAKRLSEVRLALGFKERKTLAEHFGAYASTLGKYETGISEPHPSFLILYKTGFGISLDWLITGEGEMFAAGGKKSLLQTGADIQAAHLQEAMRLVEELPRTVTMTADKKTEIVKLITAMLKKEQDIAPIGSIIAILSPDGGKT